MMKPLDFDYLIIGSGFGGSVAALRLVEKGWKVGLVEQGRHITDSDIRAAKTTWRQLMWNPGLRLRGYFAQYFFRHLSVVAGVGVGGGSIVWASVMLEPKAAFYDAPRLKQLGLDLRQELAAHFLSARRMLGITGNPRQTQQDHWLKATASAMGAQATFGNIDNAIYFGTPNEVADDPFFGGQGPARSGCNFCGGCVTGCPHNAKNSLDKNYLYLAQQQGLSLLAQSQADRIDPLPGGGYRVSLLDPFTGQKKGVLTAQHIVLAAGVLGTLRLLFRNRDTYRTLPALSPMLGSHVRTNSEAFTAVLHPPGTQVLDGTAISTHFFPDAHTHITNNRFDHGLRYMRFLFVPLVGGGSVGWRAIKTLAQMLRHPGVTLDNWFGREWESRLTAMTTMQDSESTLNLVYSRRWWWPFKKVLRTQVASVKNAVSPAPTFIAQANAAAMHLARIAGGHALSMATETFGGMANTAHILGGCPMGISALDGVINTRHEVHGYPGLFICDGSTIPANIGVNPSLTITAMAERFASLQATHPRRHP